MIQRRLVRVLTSLALVGALALAGCGRPAPTQTGSDNQTLIVGTSTIPNNLDPHKTLFSADCTYLCNLYDRLIHINPDGTLSPGLAESWEFSTDGLKLTLKIRNGVTFKDGTVLDAAGVKANLERGQSLDDSAVKNDLRVITALTIPDAKTAELTLSAPSASLLGILSGLAGAIVNPTAIKNGTDLSKTPDGAGAYELVSYAAGSELKLKRKDAYWGTKPALAELDFKIIPDGAALANALLAKQVDAAIIGPNNLKPFEGNDAYTMKRITTLYTGAMITNFPLAGLTDVRVRQAILHAIDRVTICQEILKGYCEVSDQPFPEGYYAHDDSVASILYPYDPAKAKSLLAAAGVSNLSLKAIVPSQQFMPLAQAIQSQLDAVGIKLELQQVDGSAMAQQAFVDKTAQVVVTTFGGRPDPAQLFGVRYSATGFYNPGGYTTTKMTSLYNEALKTTDPTARRTVLQAGSREAAESALAMMLYNPTDVYVLRKGVSIEPFVTGIPEWRTATVTS